MKYYAKKTAQHPPSKLSAIMDTVRHRRCGIDRLTVYVDHPDPDMVLSQLKASGATIHGQLKSLKMNAQWKYEVLLRQPGNADLQRLADALNQAGCNHVVSYLELAIDWTTKHRSEALALQSWLLGHMHLRKPYQRVEQYKNKNCHYFHRRHRGNRKAPRVVVLYADKYSKLGCDDAGYRERCCHLECRLSGQTVLSQTGIARIESLIQFDHDAFWRRQLYLVQYKKRDLGRVLGHGSNHVSDAALRKRANRLLEDCRLKSHQKERVFAFQNLLISSPKALTVCTAIPVDFLLQKRHESKRRQEASEPII